MLVTLLIPPIGVGLGVAFLDETMGASAGAGFGLIAIGLLITDGRIIDRFRQ
jgi:drug/metabolite transporter (DMT)-like permease